MPEENLERERGRYIGAPIQIIWNPKLLYRLGRYTNLQGGCNDDILVEGHTYHCTRIPQP
jgi:hypothetical protein